MVGIAGIRSALARMGLIGRHPEPHDFETSMHMLYAPPTSVASVPNIVTPTSTE
jgi:hypothetical protein